MFLIYCPFCEEHREEDEFHSAGQAHLPRPKNPDALTDEQWADFLYFRKNPCGEHRELWVHSAGCGKYFNLHRNTQTYEIYASYPAGSLPSAESSLQTEGSRSAPFQDDRQAVKNDKI
ncbi:MAG: sarcosine oxidase subunit delta [Granulosicoccus sp.]|nr:sarcosine oxidase subunit delta [Granulosicoccus sp.]